MSDPTPGLDPESPEVKPDEPTIYPAEQVKGWPKELEPEAPDDN